MRTAIGCGMWAAWLLVATVMFHFDPPTVVLYLDAEDPPADEALVAKIACPMLRVEGVPLPVPYAVRRLRRDGETHRNLPMPRPNSGLLTGCQ